jgi:hypothetical protein
MWKRSWQEQLEDPGSDVARRVAREREEREIAEQRARKEATRAAGLVPCDCGAPASCWIRSQKLRYSAANCPAHADNTLRCFRDAKLAEKDYDVSPLNLEHHMAQTAQELAS